MHITGLTFMVDDDNDSDVDLDEYYDPVLFLDDNGSNTDIVNDASLLVNVRPLSARVQGAGHCEVTGVGVFVGKSINRDGSTEPIIRRRVLVCPSFSRNIIGTSSLQRREDVTFYRQGDDKRMEAICGDEVDDIYRYDLHDNPNDADDTFLYFMMVPMDESEMLDEHFDIVSEATLVNEQEIRSFQAQMYQMELKKASRMRHVDSASIAQTVNHATIQHVEVSDGIDNAIGGVDYLTGIACQVGDDVLHDDENAINYGGVKRDVVNAKQYPKVRFLKPCFKDKSVLPEPAVGKDAQEEIDKALLSIHHANDKSASLCCYMTRASINEDTTVGSLYGSECLGGLGLGCYNSVE